MGFFSRNKEATESGLAADVPFDTLRRPSRPARRPRSTIEGRLDTPPPLDPAQTTKTRARRRLIGAIALALAAVVFVPMLFDRAPPPAVDDIALQIPDRDTPFEGRRGVPESTRGPLKGATELPSVSTPVSPGTDAPTVAPEPEAKPVEKSAEAPVAVTPPKAVDKPVAKAPTVVEKSTTPSVPPVVTAPVDDPKALAALEGRPASPPEPVGRTYAVQVAAFSAADKARGLRDQLVAAGMKSYVESVSTSQGLRTRVRLGPFASHDAADRARQKLKTMKLDGSVVPL